MKISEKQIQHLLVLVTQASTFHGISLTKEWTDTARDLLNEILNQQSDELKEIGDD